MDGGLITRGLTATAAIPRTVVMAAIIVRTASTNSVPTNSPNSRRMILQEAQQVTDQRAMDLLAINDYQKMMIALHLHLEFL